MLTRNAVGWLSWVVTLLLCSWTEPAAAQPKPAGLALAMIGSSNGKGPDSGLVLGGIGAGGLLLSLAFD